MSKKTRKNSRIFSIIIAPLIYLAAITSIVIMMTSGMTTSAVSIIAVTVAVFYTAFVIYYNLKLRSIRLNEYETSFNESFGKTVKRLDIPAMYITDKGKIIWENTKSIEMGLKEYIQDITYEVTKTQKKEAIQLKLGENTFVLHATDLAIDDEVGIFVVFVDKTHEIALAKELDDTKTTVGCIVIDSFEEIMQGLEDIDKFNTTSKIDKEIVEWVSKYNGVVSKIEKDRFVYIIEKKYVKELEDNSFEILEKMNHIAEDTLNVPITISIGMSFDDDTLYGRYKSALTSLDIAMGRGGNQAVIKNNKKFDIYDGSDMHLDKTNKVRARTISQALKDLIIKSENVYIMGHKNSDLDCVGGALGVYKIAKAYGKNAKIILDIKNNTSTQVIIDGLTAEKEYQDTFITREDCKKLDYENSLLVVVDTHKESYLAVPEIFENFDKVVVIDHHRRGPEFIANAILTYHEVYASSTAELVTELLMYLDEVKLTAKEAQAIFSGILIDTKNFTFKTGVRTFEVAAYLKKMGVDMTEIKQLFQNDFETYMARVNIVKNAEIIDGQIAISCTNEQIKDISVIAAQAADELLSISGILASFVLCELDGVIMISGRSLGDINVQVILECLGGGGHLTFAGAQLVGATLEDARAKLLEEIKEYFSKTE